MVDQTTARMKTAHLQAVRAPQAEDFLLAIPNSSPDTRPDPYDATGIVFRLTAPVYPEYQCLYGREVAEQYGHVPSCRNSLGRYADTVKLMTSFSGVLLMPIVQLKVEPQSLTKTKEEDDE